MLNDNSYNSLVDVTVGEILEIYKNDTELLKHILIAKAEEDKRRGAEEMRKAEEARLQSKFIDLQLDQSRRSSSVIDDTSLGFSSTDWLPYQATTNSSSDLISPFISNNTPPSPSQLPLSPYTLFDVPFANLNLSAPSSPVLSETTTLNKQEKKTETKEQEKERVSCKRTFSRTRSTRKPSKRKKKQKRKKRK
ncbi:hypothetical protein G6F35_013092 [Rhizopus arrhizus]|nr:hypothetical protein G6F23_004575 [Rhizopus arrhizus]KAG1195917.1 hypothetical protein G6F35_013092 [Rhizopus arrhizus]KAG1415117.1 hypothetical protein G6F58_006630 [Rhizopus delemar]